MKKITILTLILALAGFAAASAQPLPDVTGTYVGTQICDDLVDGERQNFLLADNLLLMKQDGDVVYMANFDLLYKGTIQGAEGKSAEALVSVCGGDFEAQEIVRIRRIRTNKATGEGAWDATSIFESEDGGRTYSECKWEYTRISDDEPDFTPCP